MYIYGWEPSLSILLLRNVFYIRMSRWHGENVNEKLVTVFIYPI